MATPDIEICVSPRSLAGMETLRQGTHPTFLLFTDRYAGHRRIPYG